MKRRLLHKENSNDTHAQFRSDGGCGRRRRGCAGAGPARPPAHAQALSPGCQYFDGQVGSIGGSGWGSLQFFAGEVLSVKITALLAPATEIYLSINGSIVDSVNSPGTLVYVFPADGLYSGTINDIPGPGEFVYEITCGPLPVDASEDEIGPNQITVWNVPPVRWQMMDDEGNWFTIVDENGWPYVTQPEWRYRYNETADIWERVTLSRLVLGDDNDTQHNPYHYRAIDAATGQPVGDWIEDCPEPPVRRCTSVYVGDPATTDHPGYQ